MWKMASNYVYLAIFILFGCCILSPCASNHRLKASNVFLILGHASQSVVLLQAIDGIQRIVRQLQRDESGMAERQEELHVTEVLRNSARFIAFVSRVCFFKSGVRLSGCVADVRGPTH